MRATGLELMDGPVESLDELGQNLRDIERANRFLGGLRDVRFAVHRFKPRTILDVGCGGGDIGRALLRDSEGHRRDLQVTCIDVNPQMLDIARRHAPAEMRFVLGDGRRLPFDNRTFDVAMCNLTLHHCDPNEAVLLLRELRRVSANPVMTDLRRSRLGSVLAKALAFVTTRNRLTRHDAPLSLLRAYTPDEVLTLARQAGWRSALVRRTPFFRIVLTDG